jgi:hypothetical protein
MVVALADDTSFFGVLLMPPFSLHGWTSFPAMQKRVCLIFLTCTMTRTRQVMDKFGHILCCFSAKIVVFANPNETTCMVQIVVLEPLSWLHKQVYLLGCFVRTSR